MKPNLQPQLELNKFVAILPGMRRAAVYARFVGGALLGTFAVGAVDAQTADEIKAKYDKEFQALNAKGQRLSHDAEQNKPSAAGAVINLDCKTKIGLQTVVIDVPEVTMRLQQWIFHVPATGMRETRVGPIVMHVPQFWMQEQRVSLHVPEFKIGRQEIKLHVPEVTCGDPRIKLESIKQAAGSISAEAKSLADSMKKELTQPLLVQKTAALNTIDAMIKGAEVSVAQVRSISGVDAAPFDAKLRELVAQRATVERQFDEAIAKME